MVEIPIWGLLIWQQKGLFLFFSFVGLSIFLHNQQTQFYEYSFCLFSFLTIMLLMNGV